MKNLNVYVIIVTYNGMKWIDKCLRSVVESSIEVSVVVIDNNSSDQTVAFIKGTYEKVEVIQTKENLGFGRANNLGIEFAYRKGADYFFLLNQDAYLQPTAVEYLIQNTKRYPNFGIISPMHYNGMGDALDFKFSNYIVPTRCENLYSDFVTNNLKDIIYDVKFVNAAAWILTKKCIDVVGGFNDVFFHYGEDDNYVQRIKYHGLKIGVCPKAIIYHDREKRSGNSFFDDEVLIYQRDIIGKASNPLNNFKFRKEYVKIYRLLIKSILSLSIHSTKMNYKRIMVLKKMNKKQIGCNMELSKVSQPSFLNVINFNF